MKIVSRELLLKKAWNEDSADTVWWRSTFFHRRRKLFQPYLVTLVLLLCLLLWNSRESWFLFFSLLGLLVHRIMTTQRLIEDLEVTREAPVLAKEEDEIKIKYRIVNKTFLKIHSVVFKDVIYCSTESRVLMSVESIGPYSRVALKCVRKCNAGMGHFGFGPIELSIVDPFGIFEYVLSFDDEEPIKVLPKIKPIPSPAVTGTPSSFFSGVYDLDLPMTSAQFMGVREYRNGDSLRHLAWRLSLKHGKMMVKEFEKQVNAWVTVFVDMDARGHAGWQAHSSWEVGRDLTLSLIGQLSEIGNFIQLLSQKVHLPFGRGPDFERAAQMSLLHLLPDENPKGDQALIRYDGEIPAGSTFIYVGPCFPGEFLKSLSPFVLLREKAVDIICYFIDANSFVDSKLHPGLRFMVTADAWAPTNPEYVELKNKLMRLEIPAYWVRAGMNFRDLAGQGGSTHAL